MLNLIKHGIFSFLWGHRFLCAISFGLGQWGSRTWGRGAPVCVILFVSSISRTTQLGHLDMFTVQRIYIEPWSSVVLSVFLKTYLCLWVWAVFACLYICMWTPCVAEEVRRGCCTPCLPTSVADHTCLLGSHICRPGLSSYPAPSSSQPLTKVYAFLPCWFFSPTPMNLHWNSFSSKTKNPQKGTPVLWLQQMLL